MNTDCSDNDLPRFIINAFSRLKLKISLYSLERIEQQMQNKFLQ